jgi:hypothetical protein
VGRAVLPPLQDVESGEHFAFVAATKGTHDAVYDLLWTYSNNRHKGLPIIALAVSGYEHKNKNFGWVDTPQFKIIGWHPIMVPVPATTDNKVLEAPAAVPEIEVRDSAEVPEEVTGHLDAVPDDEGVF